MWANACRASADKQCSVRKGSKCTIEVTVSLYHLRSSQAERLNHTLAGGRERERVKDTFSTHRHVQSYIKSSSVKWFSYYNKQKVTLSVCLASYTVYHFKNGTLHAPCNKPLMGQSIRASCWVTCLSRWHVSRILKHLSPLIHSAETGEGKM